jgi:alpha-glucosidase
MPLRLPNANETTSASRAGFTKAGGFRLADASRKVLLESLDGRFFAQCGEASMFEFIREKGDQFYGMGEKWTGFEHSGKITKFWNTDVWGDFNADSYIHGRPAPDPVYASIPYLILKRGNTYIGFLLDNPGAAFISTGVKASIAEQMEVQAGGSEFADAALEHVEDLPGRKRSRAEGFIHIGAESGQPSLFILVGPSLRELTRKLQTLVGTTPRPPAWALGYHQCRWGYESEKDLVELDRNFRRHGIPADGLWLDIGYMHGYRVFTFEKKHFRNPAAAFKRLAEGGRKVVPIIDPGVKREPGYRVYDSGRKHDVFCRNPQGKHYVGLVWPGETVFPDFSLPSARQWWANEVAEFARLGIYGAWLDMNDPSTGPADNSEMLFGHGRKSHATYHNQYALGMAMATYEGFTKAHPKRRPFLLSRSGSTGSNRYTAIWTGDNFSNYHHLKNSIATTLNLALSGIPFNAPDTGGFGGDATPQLITDWFKAGFLFPLFRNHTNLNTRRQEPWAFGKAVMKILRRYIRLRYRFRPYLYQLFLAHEATGEAILRPLFYDFADTRKLPLGNVDDQFLVGPHMMQAPFVTEGGGTRDVVLPRGTFWFDLAAGKWRRGGRTIRAKRDSRTTPIYIRDGAVLPLARIHPEEHVFNGSKVDFHVLLSKDGRTKTRYQFDDGETFAYRDGIFTEIEVTAKRRGRRLWIETRTLSEACGPVEFTITTEGSIEEVIIDGKAARKTKSQGEPVIPSGRTWKI